MRKRCFPLFLMLVIMTGCVKERVDLIIVNAKIYTVDSSFSIARSMAVKDGKIVWVGEDARESGFASDRIEDIHGGAIYPGFIDAHSHFSGYGEGLVRWCDLRNATSWEEIVKRVKLFSEGVKGEWVLGRGWDQNLWKSKDFPTKALLDELFPTTPVALTRIDGHAMIANSEALKRAQIDESTVFDGGAVLKIDGKLSGVLLDNAMEAVYSVIPPLSKEELALACQTAENNCYTVGLTTVNDAGLDYRVIHEIDSLQQANQLSIRIMAWLNPNEDNLVKIKAPYTTDRLWVTAIKLYADGALGSRGALLKKPYSDRPETSGLQLQPRAYYEKWGAIALDRGFQLNTHAIGDSAVRLMLDVYGSVLKGQNDYRWRIEHAQVVSSSDVALFKKYNIIPSMQPTHATSDMYWAGERLGDRVAQAYMLKRLLNANGWIPLGTDFPIESIDPLKTFFAAVFRQDTSGFPMQGFQMKDALSREEALKGMTIWAAKAGRAEEAIGSIEVGKKADFVLLSNDILTVPKELFFNTKVEQVWLDGLPKIKR